MHPISHAVIFRCNIQSKRSNTFCEFTISILKVQRFSNDSKKQVSGSQCDFLCLIVHIGSGVAYGNQFWSD